MRALSGELIYVHNSQVLAARVLPRGLREVSIELFVRDEEAGRAAFQEAARVMPIGPTEFVRPPWIDSVQRLDSDLIHIRARATLAPGREWLAHEFLPDVLKERAGPELIVHGPVVLDFDETARRRFAHASEHAARRQLPPDSWRVLPAGARPRRLGPRTGDEHARAIGTAGEPSLQRSAAPVGRWQGVCDGLCQDHRRRKK